MVDTCYVQKQRRWFYAMGAGLVDFKRECEKNYFPLALLFAALSKTIAASDLT